MTSSSDSPLADTPRSCRCVEVSTDHLGRELVLKGWTRHRRDHGGVLFIDLVDRSGLVQVVFDPEEFSPEDFDRASRIKLESVLAVRGKVRRRPEGTVNPALPTGEIEVLLSDYEILSPAATLPFPIDEHFNAGEDQRLRYRYLDLRRPEMQRNLVMRAQVARTIRRTLDEHGFIEVETPCLTRSTPEGARDFLVPSRLMQGSFYALPQSPQLFKQLLMVAGMDRYYQIVRCFRDEDLRANRQPEFTQLDVEMSFITPPELFAVMETTMAAVWREALGVEIKTPFDRVPFDEAMARYGSDKPDRRFAMEIRDLTGAVAGGGCEFKVFNDLLEGGKAVIRGLCVPGGGERYSNTQLKPGGELPSYAERHGAKGLAWFRVTGAEGAAALDSSISKFFSTDCQRRMIEAAGAAPGDLILIVADRPAVAANALGQVRLKLGAEMGLIPEGVYDFCWVTDFPLLEWNPEERRWYSMHHPFTMPAPEDLERLESDPGSVRALAYDMALNGEEIGGGSIRIHRRDVQERVFRALGIGDEEAREKFGFLMEALQFGAPPHGGIAFGLDRILMLILGAPSIRDVIPFPKTQTGSDLMVAAPSAVDEAQLRELGLRPLRPK